MPSELDGVGRCEIIRLLEGNVLDARLCDALFQMGGFLEPDNGSGTDLHVRRSWVDKSTTASDGQSASTKTSPAFSRTSCQRGQDHGLLILKDLNDRSTAEPLPDHSYHT